VILKLGVLVSFTSIGTFSFIGTYKAKGTFQAVGTFIIIGTFPEKGAFTANGTYIGLCSGEGDFFIAIFKFEGTRPIDFRFFLGSSELTA
jgi:hypothetical protein